MILQMFRSSVILKFSFFPELLQFTKIILLENGRHNLNRKEELLLGAGKQLPTNRRVLGSLLDSNFDKTLLTLPVLGIFVFTVLPITNGLMIPSKSEK